MKQILLDLFRQTLEESSVGPLIASTVRRAGPRLIARAASVDVEAPDRILVASIGKAARPMSEALAPLLDVRKTSFLVVAPESPGFRPDGVRTFAGGHPYPDAVSETAAKLIRARAQELGPEDLFICLLSGGGSAICEASLHADIPLEDLRTFFEVVVTCGASIVDMNVLRKHLSLIKGGRLAQAASPARQLTLYVSDVPPGEDSSVASGPTMPDGSTCEDAYRIAGGLDIVPRFPATIRRRFEQRALEETPKAGSVAFERSQWVCLLDNTDVLSALEARARSRGWFVERDLSVDDRPVESAADVLLDRLQALAGARPGRTVAVTTGGELSSPVTGTGMGGRNQAFVLCAARKIAQRGMRAIVLSAGTDGVDGNSPAAGAVADETTIARAGALGMDALDFQRRADSHQFFRRLGDLIMTGPTGNNVRDLRMLVAGHR